MTFNINTFKSKVFNTKYGGLGRPTFFELRVSGLPGPIDTSDRISDDLRFFCTTASFPGISLTTFNYYPDSIGLPQSVPTGIEYAPLSAIVLLDDNHKIISFFHRWMQAVYNFDSIDKLSPRAADSNHFPHEIGYKKDYSCKIDIINYSAHNPNNFYQFELFDAYPYQFSPLDLSWDMDNAISRASVQFSYSKFRVKALAKGSLPEFKNVSGTNVAERNNSGLNQQLINESARNLPFLT